MTIKNFFRRYRYILLLLVILLIFGQKILPPEPNGLDQQVYQLNPSDQKFLLFDRFPTQTNQRYRVTYALRLAPTDQAALANADASVSQISLNRRTEFAADSTIQTFTLQTVSDWQYSSAEFVGTGGEESLEVAKNPGAGSVSIAVRPLTLLAISANASDTVTFGQGKDSVALDENLSTARTVASPLTGGGRIMASKFTATTDNIDQVELALSQNGYGGNGNYHLSLNEIDQTNGGVKIGRALSDFEFSPGDLGNWLTTSGNYRFPLAAKLTIGDQYLIVVNASEVTVSPLHNLAVGVQSQADHSLYHLRSLSDQLSGAESSSLAMRLYTKVGVFSHSSRLLEGETIQDRGDYLFTNFSLLDEPTALLDVDSFDPGQNADSSPYFGIDNSRVEMQVNGKASYQYKIPLGGTLHQAEIAFRTTSPASPDITLAYSLDGQSWQTIQPAAFARDGLIRQSVTGETSTLYLRIQFAPSTYSRAIFGLDQLTVNAEVNR